LRDCDRGPPEDDQGFEEISGNFWREFLLYGKQIEKFDKNPHKIVIFLIFVNEIFYRLCYNKNRDKVHQNRRRGVTVQASEWLQSGDTDSSAKGMFRMLGISGNITKYPKKRAGDAFCRTLKNKGG